MYIVRSTTTINSTEVAYSKDSVKGYTYNGKVLSLNVEGVASAIILHNEKDIKDFLAQLDLHVLNAEHSKELINRQVEAQKQAEELREIRLAQKAEDQAANLRNLEQAKREREERAKLEKELKEERVKLQQEEFLRRKAKAEKQASAVKKATKKKTKKKV